MATLQVLAPLDGWSLVLEEVPDPVFAGALAGDGVAVDPTGNILHAPCAGEVVLLPRQRHAVSIRTRDGLTILMHVGIDTVTLGGEGFELLVEAGDAVEPLQPLLRFDLDLIVRRAPSAITPIVLGTDSAAIVARRTAARLVRVGEPLFEIETRSTSAAPSPQPASGAAGCEFRVPYEHGLHARPAALLVAALKPFHSQVTLSAGGRSANLRSATALMALGLRFGDAVRVSAIGADADAALDAVAALLSRAEPVATPVAPRAPSPPRPAATVVPTAPLPSDRDPRRLSGVIAVPGLALGEAVPWTRTKLEIVEIGSGEIRERLDLQRAREQVRAHLEALLAASAGPQRGIVGAHLELIEDPDLTLRAESYLKDGKSAAFAWHAAVQHSVTTLRALSEPRLAERAADLLDLEAQVLRVLAGQAPQTAHTLPEQSILIADEIYPSQLLGLDARRIAGIAMAAGGATSHVAIIAAAQGIPVLVALGEAVLSIQRGAPLILDAERGFVLCSPDTAERLDVERNLARRAELRIAEQAAARQPCVTADGVRIAIYCNLGTAEEAQSARALGAEGCGLLRTELLFLDRATAPDEEEQTHYYQQIAAALQGQPLTVRTLDAGGDKPIAYLTLPREDNPALGLRGVRTSLAYPQLLTTQLRAILRVRPCGQCRILLPMITDVEEVRVIRQALSQAAADLGVTAVPALGVMIETPAAAVLADQLAAEVDFLSIGSNDLSQYTLAMDRTHPQMAARLDALHPAVLRLIKLAADAAHVHQREVAVCGAIASDAAASALLIGLGIRELSAVAAQIPHLKQTIRRLDSRACAELAANALRQDSAHAVRALLPSDRDRG